MRVIYYGAIAAEAFQMVTIAPLLRRRPVPDGPLNDARLAGGNKLAKKDAFGKFARMARRDGRRRLHSRNMAQDGV